MAPKTSDFDNRKMAACLRAQARLCERMASLCWSEDEAGQYRAMALECEQAADAQAKAVTQAAWPAIYAF